MRFSTFIVATGLLATSVMAVPNPGPEAEALHRAGKFGYWCVAPGQMCYKNKRDLDEAKADIIAGFQPYSPEAIEKREASPEAAPEAKKALHRAGKFGYWCVAPGQMCYKNKRDLDTVKEAITAGEYAPLPSDFE